MVPSRMQDSTLSIKKICRSVLAIAFWLFIWQCLAWVVGATLLLPEPVTVFHALGRVIQATGFYASVGRTLFGIMIGFLSGVLAGTLLAVFTWASPLAHALFSPILRLVRTTPVASFIILALLWLSNRTVPMFIAGLMVTPILWSSTRTAIAETNADLLEMARAYRFSCFRKIRLIYLPQVLPQWTAACATAMGLAWKSGVAAEVIAQPIPAMGTSLFRSKLLLDTEQLFAWTILVVLLSFILERLFVRLMAKMGRRYTL